MLVHPRGHGRRNVKVSSVGPDPFLREFEVIGVEFDADAVSPPAGTCEIGRPRPHERVEYGIADEREHPDQPFGKFERIWGRVFGT